MTSQHPSTPQLSVLRAAMAEPELSPLTSHLDAQLGEVAIRRMWSNIDTRPRNNQSNGLRFTSLKHWTIPAFSAVLFVLAFYVTTSLWDNRAPLASSNGASAEELNQGIHAEAATRQITFVDGSRIHLEAQSSLRVLSNGGGSFVTKLDQGGAVFHVTPGGPRRWIVEAGDVTVEVVGTVFSVNRDSEGVSVSVERGIVLVRGQVPGGEVRLTRGQKVSTRPSSLQLSAEVDLPSKKPVSSKEEPRNAEPGRTISLSDLVDETAQGDEVSQQDSSTEKQASFTDASAPTEPQIETAQQATDPTRLRLDELLEYADIARREGKNEQAASYFYLASLRASSEDSRRGMAALSFARISSDQGAIVRTLIRGLSSMPPSLREPALARLVRAAQKAGNTSLATKYARVYLEEFPVGPRAELVKSWANLP